MQADILREEIGESPLKVHIAELTQAAKQCVEIVQHFLSLARKQPPQRTQVALNAVVETAMKLLAYPMQVDNISVEYSLADDLPVLWADAHQLQQVVVNLLTNAHQALCETSGRRQLTITTRAEHSRQRLVLEIADTGLGIPAAIRQRIFEPFFTTKPPDVGTAWDCRSASALSRDMAAPCVWTVYRDREPWLAWSSPWCPCRQHHRPPSRWCCRWYGLKPSWWWTMSPA